MFRRHQSACWLLCMLAGTALAAPAWGQEAAEAIEPESKTVQTHPVSLVRIVYLRDNPGHPDPDSLLQAEFEASEVDGALTIPTEGQPTRKVKLADLFGMPATRLTDPGLTLLAPAVVKMLKDAGLVGVYVTPDPAQFRVVEGKVVDLRPEGDTSLTLQVTTGIVTDVRTVGLGERVPEDQTTNNPIHARIRERSPVQPSREGESQSVNLLRTAELDDYVARLNRHPGRRVDVAVSAAGDEPGAVTLDYLVTENRPWMLFAQISNTGTESTDKLREHFGFIHNNLSNADDIFTVGYQTANFEDVHALYGSYERPLLGSEYFTWQVNGSYYEYVASELGLPGADFRGNGWNAGGEVAWNFYQQRELFLDLFAGARFEHIRVDNQLAAIEGKDDFFIPGIGVRLERQRESSTIDAEVAVEFNMPDLAGTDDNLDDLGRIGAVNDWFLLRGNVYYSQFLDPFFDSTESDKGGLANELAFAARGQYAFDSRLIPNEEMPLGGLYTVRGYPEAITAGDTAIAASAEYRYHIARGIDPDPEPGSAFGRSFRFKPQYEYGPTDWDLILKGFVDVGRAVNSDRQSFEADNTLVGAGLGIELAITRRFNVRVDWGVALRDIQDGTGATTVDSGNNEFHFIVTAIF